MKTIKKLGKRDLQAALTELPDWKLKKGKLHREYVFSDFVNAFGFMTHMALIAESQNHHPEWFNVYKKVIVDLSTHEASGITTRDLKLAREMERTAARSVVNTKEKK